MPSATQSSTRKRTIHQLDTPFSNIAWPEISANDQDAILELLCSLLSPLGNHRRTHVKPSNGKRALKKQKTLQSSDMPLPSTRPHKPELCDKVDIGFNSITKKLQESAAVNKDDVKVKQVPYSMVFVSRGDQTSAFNSHFPQMVAVASRYAASNQEIRLVGFSRSCSERLSSTLGIARVSSLAIGPDSPEAQALLDFVRKTVSPIKVSWLAEAEEGTFRQTNIKSIETTVGNKRVKGTAS